VARGATTAGFGAWEMTTIPASAATPAAALSGVAGRWQIGGIVGTETDPFTLARSTRALGRAGAWLHASSTFVGEWDTCFARGVALADPAAWERSLASGQLAEIDGAFAVAWLDADGALHLARDAIGERSLFYARVDGGLVFASTLQAVLACPSVRRTFDLRSVASYLTFGYIPGRETLVEGVFELLPGEEITFADGRLTRRRFWTAPGEDERARTEARYRRDLRARLEAAVDRRLPQSGPVVAALSGGIDSSLVVALARRRYDGPITTYSLSFGPRYPNELAFSRLVAAHCRTEHRVLEVSPRAVMDRFDATLAALSKPIGEALTVPNALLFESASAETEVVLNGEGGDPCFGGPKNVPMILSELYRAGDHGQPARWQRERAYLRAHRKCYAELDRMLTADVALAIADAPLEDSISAHLTDPRWTTLVNRLTALNVAYKGAHHILAKVDHLSRPHSVRPRSPLFDRSVVELALRMPARLKLNGAVEKYILKRAVEDVVPREIIDRPKSGMRVPVEAWLEGRFERFARERLLDGLAPYGLVRRTYMEELVKPGRALPPPKRGAKTWLLLSLEAWLRTVFAAGGKASDQRLP
jgi:asparagine synthase (glutamine-hydrolysing)